MKKLDCYIFREFVKRFALFSLVIVFVVILCELQARLEKFLSAHLSFGSILRYCTVYIVNMLPLILPITFLTTSVFLVCSLAKKREITICLASRISFMRMVRVLWPIAIIISLFLLFGIFKIFPWSQRTLTNYFKQISFNQQTTHLLVDHCQALYHIGSYDLATRLAEEISICQYGTSGKETRRLYAQSGIFDKQLNCWKLLQGRETWFDKDHIPMQLHHFKTKVFPYLDASPEVMFLKKRPVEQLSLPELLELKNFEDEQHAYLTATYNTRILMLILQAFSTCFLLWFCLPFLLFKPMEGASKNISQMVLYLGCFFVFLHTFSALSLKGGYPLGINLIIPLTILFFAPFIRWRRHQIWPWS